MLNCKRGGIGRKREGRGERRGEKLIFMPLFPQHLGTIVATFI
jgi:hypothetical protein